MAGDSTEERHRQHVDQLVNLARAARLHPSAELLLHGHTKDYLRDGRIEALVAAAEAEPRPLAGCIGASLDVVFGSAVLRDLDEIIDIQHTALGEVALRAIELRLQHEGNVTSVAALGHLRYRRVERLMYLGRHEEAAQALEDLETAGAFGRHGHIVVASAKCNSAVLRSKLGEIEGPLAIIEEALVTLRQAFADDVRASAETLGGALIAGANLMLRAGRVQDAAQACAEAHRVLESVQDTARRLDLSAACAEVVIDVMLQAGPRRGAGKLLRELCANAREMAQDYPHRCAERAVITLLNAAGTFADRLGALRRAEQTLDQARGIMRLLPPDWGLSGLDGFLLAYGASSLEVRFASLRQCWDATALAAAGAERLRRASAWRRHPAVSSIRVAVLSALSVAMFSTGRIQRALRLVALAETIQRRLGLGDPRMRANVFAMRSNAAFARSSIGQGVRARMELEAACDELLDQASVPVIGRDSLIDALCVLAQLQWEAQDRLQLFWSLCHMACLSATGELMSPEDAAGTEHLGAAGRFVQMAHETNWKQSFETFRGAWRDT
jgi:hypothetical protein